MPQGQRQGVAGPYAVIEEPKVCVAHAASRHSHEDPTFSKGVCVVRNGDLFHRVAGRHHLPTLK